MTFQSRQSPYSLVREFHEAFGMVISDDPSLEDGVVKLRLALIDEEVAEFREAVESGDVLHSLAELADVLYVVYGTAVSLGLDVDAALVEIHRANMTKLGDDGKPIIRDDGKVLKGPNFTPADLTSILVNRT